MPKSLHKTVSHKGYGVHKPSVSDKTIAKLVKTLTVTPKSSLDPEQVESYNIYKEEDDMLYIPKFVGIKSLGAPVEKWDTVQDKNFKFKGKLKDFQEPVVKECLEKIRSFGGGLIKLPCGKGKTVVSIYLATQLKVKTLIIVDRSFLQDQWYERIKQFSTARVDTIRQKHVPRGDPDIVIGMLQSISKRDYPEEVFNGFGLVIVDECHHIASRTFSTSLFKTGAPYTIGLSATPKREDGLTKVINWHLGPMMFEMDADKEQNRHVVVKKFNYLSTDKLFAEKKRWWQGRMRPDTGAMITNVCKIEGRNNFIVKILNILRTFENRKILILSARVSKEPVPHLGILKDKIDAILKKEVEEGKLEEDEIKTGFYIGPQKDYERKESEDADLIFATEHMASEALDIPGLNVVVFTTSIKQDKKMEQSVGRIMRRVLEAGDITPLVIDIGDKLSALERQSDARNKFYKKSGYNIEYYDAKDEDLTTKDNSHGGVVSDAMLAMLEACSDSEDSNKSSDEEPVPELREVLDAGFCKM